MNKSTHLLPPNSHSNRNDELRFSKGLSKPRRRRKRETKRKRERHPEKSVEELKVNSRELPANPDPNPKPHFIPMASQHQAQYSVSDKDNKEWTEEELREVFNCYKKHGAKWAKVAESFPGRNANDVKNKFYTTLKKVATRAQLENPIKYDSSLIKCKRNLIQFIDLAFEHGFGLSSKRGRKQKAASKHARQNPILFPEVSEGAGRLSAARPAKEQKKEW
eukprot:TRINITY_DN2974_c0_g1_i11.p1 TRINITY_DN2974_c0_g1~~TRINITY_DN2974_c0_g1_i11.p1  ORF type:complete len:220 (-),score=32.11 TRINITY_DN2974_c0_g1_i11:203-862(-)